MLIGILEVGRPPDELAHYDSYAGMSKQLLKDDALQFQVFAVLNGEHPSSPTDCDAWLITGSKYGVYENLPWMLKLQDFIRAVRTAEVPMIGICFGHQIIAQALGGEVQKSSKGWGIGVHDYQVQQPLPSMQNEQAFRIYAMHQDQVITKPPEATVVASSDFCEYAALLYGDSILTFQGHPEFVGDFERDLLELRKGSVIPEAQANAVLAELEAGTRQPQSEKVGQWLRDFLKQRS